MSLRRRLEELEDRRLAPCAIRSTAAGGREYPESPQEQRTEFQRDRDRIIHSTAFRRLEYKTQVFPNHEGDHYRTRLTHTIEVANLARTLARSLDLNEDFTECLALAHDIGHPPFGHCGEEVLSRLMEPYGGFEHNEQSYRLLTVLEKGYAGHPGLNLTREILKAVLQHTREYRRRYPEGGHALLETRLVSIADEMVYDAHDLDDGLSSGILTEGELAPLEFWREAVATQGFPRDAGPDVRRRTAVRAILNLLVQDFIATARSNLEMRAFRSKEEAQPFSAEVLRFSAHLEGLKGQLELFLRERMYRHPTVLKMMNKSKYFVERLFQHFKEFPTELPREFQERFARDGVERSIADYIAGMTDRFLQEEYVRIFMPFQKML